MPRLHHILSALLLLLTAAPLLPPVQAAPEPNLLELKRDLVIINNLTELNHHLEQLALRAQHRTNCLFAGKYKGREQATIAKSLWQNYSRAYTITYHPDGSVLLDFEYKDHIRLLAAHRHPEQRAALSKREQEALHAAQELLRHHITADMSTYDKVLTLHDVLIERTTYAHSNSGDCCAVLLDGFGVCDGYSRTLWLLLRMCDIPCLIVIGHTTEPHAWNLVRLNKSWYHIDPTWDDPATTGGHDQILSHNYFLLSDEQISHDHNWDRNSVPPAVVRDSLYFRNNKRYFNNYAQMWQSVVLAIRNGDTEYEAYLADFGNKENFLRSLRSHSQRHPELSAIHTWTGPVNRSKGVIRLTFHHSDSPTALKDLIADFFSELISSLGKLLSDLFSAITKAIRSCF